MRVFLILVHIVDGMLIYACIHNSHELLIALYLSQSLNRSCLADESFIIAICRIIKNSFSIIKYISVTIVGTFYNYTAYTCMCIHSLK